MQLMVGELMTQESGEHPTYQIIYMKNTLKDEGIPGF